MTSGDSRGAIDVHVERDAWLTPPDYAEVLDGVMDGKNWPKPRKR